MREEGLLRVLVGCIHNMYDHIRLWINGKRRMGQCAPEIR